MVIAESADLAQDAADLADLDFDVLPAAADVNASLAQEQPLHEGVAQNLSARFQTGDAAERIKLFKRLSIQAA